MVDSGNKSPTIWIPNENLNLTSSGEMNKLYEPYLFEHMALAAFYGYHWTKQITKKVIITAYVKVRPVKQIEKLVEIADASNIPDLVLSNLMVKWLHKNEYLLNIKIDSEEGRREMARRDEAEGVDTRTTVSYSPDYKDPWDNRE